MRAAVCTQYLSSSCLASWSMSRRRRGTFIFSFSGVNCDDFLSQGKADYDQPNPGDGVKI